MCSRGRSLSTDLAAAAVLAVLLLITPSLAAADTNTPVRRDYSSFQTISERNIFNSRRSGRSTRPARETSRPRVVDSFQLVGTLCHDRGEVAFFDGTSSDYRKAYSPGGTIAGHQISSITPTNVHLAAGTNTITLRVGDRMRRDEDDKEWRLASSEESFTTAPDRRTFSSDSRPQTTDRSQAAASTASGAAGDESEILKKLMEKRERELQ